MVSREGAIWPRIAAAILITLGAPIATIAAFLLPKGLGYPIFIALKAPTPFKTEIYSAGALTVALALGCDAALIGLRRLVVPWARKGLA